MYFQDDFKVTPKLTVNLGLRWEYFGQLIENYGAQSNFLPSGNSNPSEFLITKQRCNTPLSPDFFAAAATDNIYVVCSGFPGWALRSLPTFRRASGSPISSLRNWLPAADTAFSMAALRIRRC